MFSDDLRPRGSSDALTHVIPLHELQCYNLPFGGLGFTSHILTYYTIACLWFGRKPLWPFKKIHYTKLDLVLASIGLALCIVMSIITMVNCKNTWQLLVIGVWKMSMSLLNGVTALHVAILVVNDAEEQVMKSRKTAWWLLLYAPGMMAGMTGLMNLVAKVAKDIPELLDITIAFYMIIGASLIVSIVSMVIICYWGGGVPEKVVATGFAVTLALFLVCSVLYSDWCLGIMLDNLVGVPSSDKSTLYWTYFVAKRLTMLSW